MADELSVRREAKEDLAAFGAGNKTQQKKR